MRRFVLGICVVMAGLAGAAAAQGDRESTLADIRQEMSVLHVELQKLKRELSTTGGAKNLVAGGSVIERVSAIESELQRLTAKTEELQHRIDRIVRDGTNRLGDLEFRLCELESDCDIAQLDEGTTLGGETAAAGAGMAAVTTPAGDPGTDGAQLAISEQDDFDAAQKALDQGDYATAADLFARFRQDYPESPLEAKARLKRGEALEAAGMTSKAARVYLDTFSAAPNGAQAPVALYRVGRALGRLGKTEDACTTLAEVGYRFPGGQPAQQAREEMQRLGCQ